MTVTEEQHPASRPIPGNRCQIVGGINLSNYRVLLGRNNILNEPKQVLSRNTLGDTDVLFHVPCFFAPLGTPLPETRLLDWDSRCRGSNRLIRNMFLRCVRTPHE